MNTDEVIYSSMEMGLDQWRKNIEEHIGSLIRLCLGIGDESRVSYIIGYCWFHMPGNEILDYRESRRWLEKSISIDNRNYNAYLFLGALNFEFGFYCDAVKALNNIPRKYFENRGKRWRDIKVKEMLFCCNAYLGDFDKQFFAMLINEYLEDENFDLPLPSELVECVVQLRKIKDNEIVSNNVINDVVNMIHVLELETPFTDELAFFESIL